jgi:putative redox protein
MKLIASTRVEGATGYAQKIRSGGHDLTADEPTSAGGTDTGPSPYGLLLSSLGACTSITLRMYAQKKGWELGTITVELKHFKDAESDKIERELRFGAPLTDEQRAKLLDIASKTPVTRTLMRGTPIETRIAEASASS